MRYLVALIIGIGALFGVNYFADLFFMPRPWNALLMGGTVGITMVVVLLIWEVVRPSHRDAAPAKPVMSGQERAAARAERRARLAAEAGVSLEDNDGPGATSTTSTAEGETPAADAESNGDEEDAESPESDESSIEAEPSGVESGQDEPRDIEVARDEPDTLAPDEFDEEATGSSLENPPTGEPGVSVDALEDAEFADDDGAAGADSVGDDPVGDDPVGDESTRGESDSKS